MLRRETRARARALQLLYAWELAGSPVRRVEITAGLGRLLRPRGPVLEDADALMEAVIADLPALDLRASAAADNWPLDRMAAVERNILRIAIHELVQGSVPPKVAIDEAVRLAHWFGGEKAPGFVNGVLDRAARDLGLL